MAAKVTLPAPTVLDFRLDEEHLDATAYPRREDLFDDVVQAYRDALQAFYDAGARYVQLDDTGLHGDISARTRRLPKLMREALTLRASRLATQT